MNKTLLLTPWGSPQEVLHWHDAITMMYKGTVDVVIEYEDEVSSPSVTWKIPSILRLKKLPKIGKRQLKFSRKGIYTRDHYRCQYCGDDTVPVDFLSYDHVIPASKGGKTTWTNIVTSCKKCNCKKGDMSCEQANMFPLKKPIKPRTLPFEPNIVDIERAPKEWLDYLQ